jgi:hypothetical protein
MEFKHLDDAVGLLEKANANLQPELLTVAGARERLEVYARAGKLIDYGIAALAARIDDATSLARATGTSVPKPPTPSPPEKRFMTPRRSQTPSSTETSPWTRRVRSAKRRRLPPARQPSCSRWPPRSPSPS